MSTIEQVQIHSARYFEAGIEAAVEAAFEEAKRLEQFLTILALALEDARRRFAGLVIAERH